MSGGGGGGYGANNTSQDRGMRDLSGIQVD